MGYSVFICTLRTFVDVFYAQSDQRCGEKDQELTLFHRWMNELIGYNIWNCKNKCEAVNTHVKNKHLNYQGKRNHSDIFIWVCSPYLCQICPCPVLTVLVLCKCDVFLISRVQYTKDCIQIGGVEQIWPSLRTLLRNLQFFQLINQKTSGLIWMKASINKSRIPPC